MSLHCPLLFLGHVRVGRPLGRYQHQSVLAVPVPLQRIRCHIRCATENTHMEKNAIFLLLFFEVLCLVAPLLEFASHSILALLFPSLFLMSNSAVQSRTSDPWQTSMKNVCVCVGTFQSSEVIVSEQPFFFFPAVIIFSVLTANESKKRNCKSFITCRKKNTTSLLLQLIWVGWLKIITVRKWKLAESIPNKKTKQQIILSDAVSPALLSAHPLPLCIFSFSLHLCSLVLFPGVIWQLKRGLCLTVKINIHRGTVGLKGKTKHCSIQWITSNVLCSLRN